MHKTKVVIVIPVHTPTPTADELIAFSQCFKILYSYDIVVLCPEGLNLDRYHAIKPQFVSVAIPAKWLSSIGSYNELKCSTFFYKLFKEYDYLLTYELDAFVFNDELSSWCSKGYSYIGAPWFEGYALTTPSLILKGVGNSGFSLRNVQVCLKILKRINSLKSIHNTLSKIRGRSITDFVYLIEKGLGFFFKIRHTKHLPSLIHECRVNEDVFWSDWCAYTFTDFKLAPTEEALKFSFEVMPDYLFEVNGRKLPFGCHAWKKYNYEFWKPYLIREGYKLLL